MKSRESDPPCQHGLTSLTGIKAQELRWEESLTLTRPLHREGGLSRPGLPHRCGPLPGRNKPAAKLHTNSLLPALRERKGTEVSGRPAPRLLSAVPLAGPCFRTPRTPRGQVGSSPRPEIKAAPLAAPWFRTPVQERPRWRPRTKAARPSPFSCWWKAGDTWTRCSASSSASSGGPISTLAGDF